MLDLARLAKIWKLTTSPNLGEAAAARNRARAIVERHGKTLSDIPDLLRIDEELELAKQAAAGVGVNPFRGFDDFMEKAEPGFKVRRAREAAERRQREKESLAELLNRYGSKEDIIRLSATEATLRAAVLKWCAFQRPPYDKQWILTIDGQREPYPLEKMKIRVRNALSKAVPLPTNITEAFAEYTMWEERDREMQLALEAMGDTQLDLPAAFRREIVRNLLEVGLRARSIAEVLIRQRYIVNSQMSQPETEKAVLLDLEELVAQRNDEGSASGAPPTKAPKRAGRRAPGKPSQPDMFL